MVRSGGVRTPAVSFPGGSRRWPGLVSRSIELPEPCQLKLAPVERELFNTILSLPRDTVGKFSHSAWE